MRIRQQCCRLAGARAKGSSVLLFLLGSAAWAAAPGAASAFSGGVAQGILRAAVGANAPVSSKLSAWKVEEKGGSETLVAAGKVAPGDVIEYRVEYKNAGSKDVRDLTATLPIPSTTTYVERSTRPVRAQASTNGRNYGSVPLRRRVKKAGGGVDVVDVPAGQYRFLRWTVPTLGAGQSVSFTARARVNAR